MLRQDSQYWKRFWDKQQTGLHASADPFYLPWLAAELNLILPSAFGRAVLDLGCGSGQLFALLKFNRAARYRGVDISPSMLGRFQSDFPGTELILSAVESYVTDDKFDLIVSNAVVQYLNRRQLDRLLNNIAAMLAPCGFAVLSMIPWSPLRMTYHSGDIASPGISPFRRARRLIRATLADPIGNWYTWRTLRRLAHRHGLDPFFFGSMSDPYRFHVLLTRITEHGGAGDQFLRGLLASRRR